MKKATLFLISILSVLAMFAFGASAAEIVAEGTCGKGNNCGDLNTDAVVWTLTDDWTLTLSGHGEVERYYDLDQPPWYEWLGKIKSVVVEEGITALNFCDFGYCTALKSVTLPDSLERISGAFYCSDSLEEIVLPDGLKELDESAFAFCTSLKTVKLPESLEKIGNNTFKSCTSLESIHIPAGVKAGEIFYPIFEDCVSLKSVTVSSENTDFAADSQGVLYSKDMTVLYEAPAGLTGEYSIASDTARVNSRAFYKCANLTAVSIPDGVEILENNTFFGCSSLESVELGAGLTKIDNYAFYNCQSLRELRIPAGVTSIGEKAIRGCDSLIGIWVDGGNLTYASDESGVLFSADKTVLIQVPNHLVGDYTVPDTVTEIAIRAFPECASMTNLYIPASVEKIGDQKASLYKNSVPYFSGCLSLEGIWVDGDNISFKNDENGVLYDKAGTMLIHFPAKYTGDYTVPADVTFICNQAFTFAKELGSVWVEEGNRAFSSDTRGALMSGSELIRVPPKTDGEYTIPEIVTSVRSDAFDRCDSITRLNITKNVGSINNLFDLPSLDFISVDEDNERYSSDKHGILYDKATYTMYCIPTGYKGEYILPFTVRVVDMRGVANVAGLTALTFTGPKPTLAAYSGSGAAILRYPANLNSWRELPSNTDHLNWQPYELDYTLGDADRDGKLTNVDLVTLARYSVGLYKSSDTPYRLVPDFSDMNGDGEIDNIDLVSLAMAIVER